MCAFAIKRLYAFRLLKHVSFDINHLYQFVTPTSTPNSTKHKGDNKTRVTPFSLRIYSTLKFTDGIKCDGRSHKNTQAERYEQEVIKCNQIHNTDYITNSQARCPMYGVLFHRLQIIRYSVRKFVVEEKEL